MEEKTVTKSKNFLSKEVKKEEEKEEIKQEYPGRITTVENDMATMKDKVKSITEDVSKMMYMVIFIGVLLFGLRFADVVNYIKNGDPYQVQLYIELVLSAILSYFGIKTSFKYNSDNKQRNIDDFLKDFEKFKENFGVTVQKNERK